MQMVIHWIEGKPGRVRPGGLEGSVFGDRSVYGTEGVHFYTRPKVVTTRWQDPSQRGVDLGFPKTR